MKNQTNTELELSEIKPLYEQIFDYLNDLITTNQLKPGDQLPSEKDLETMFDVSKVTVRRAIQELVYENKATRIAGKGSFVLEPRIEPLTALTSFSENIRAQGFEPSYKDSKVSFPVPKQKIMDFFGIQQPDQVLHIYRIMCADRAPVSIQYAYYPLEIYQKNPSLFTPEVLNQISIYRILELEFGIQLFRAEEYVDASIADEDEARILDIHIGDPILVIERLTYSVDQKPTEFVKLIFPSRKYRYKVELFRPGKQMSYSDKEVLTKR